MRKVFVGGNWKCNGTADGVKALAAAVSASVPSAVEVVVAPAMVHLERARSGLGNGAVMLAAQNCVEKDGAFTGEVSARMLHELQVPWVILGHSERRTYYGETDAVVRAKVSAALGAGLRVIACVGESLEERDGGRTLEVVRAQMDALVAGVPAGRWADVVVAYEPKWAIGTGRTASPEQAEEVHAAVRAHLQTAVDGDVAAAVRLIYGGSVNKGNAAALIEKPNIDGFLVGGASLDAEHFATICNLAAKL